MSQPTGSLYEVRWSELFPWLILAKAWRVSLLVRVLAFAWLGLLLTQWGWSVVERIAGNSPPQLEHLVHRSGTALMDIRELKATERRLAASSLFQVDPPPDELITAVNTAGDSLGWREHFLTGGPLIRGWSWISSPFVSIFERDTSLVSAFFKLLCGLWAIAVWGICGGAIARTAARYLTRDEIIGPIAAGRTAITTWPATAGGPALMLLFAAALCLPLGLLGLLVRADSLAMLTGLAWGLTLAWGLFIAVVLVALWFGWPLMWATTAVERSDAFDAVARTASYVYQRPIRLAFYVLVAALLGVFGQLIVSGFVAAGDYLTDWAVSWGAGGERLAQLTGEETAAVEPTLEGSGALAARFIGAWKYLLAAIPAAYSLAYLFSSCVGIYLLLRLQIDSTEMDEIAEEVQANPIEV